MKILIQNALIIDPLSAFNNKKCDIFIEDFFIKDIQLSAKNHTENLDKKIKLFDAKGLYLMPGLTDMRANIPDPGFEFKEDFESAAKAALNGGFTTVAVLPDTQPVIDNKSAIEYVINKNKTSEICFLPLGAISKNLKGEELTEMYDMYMAGAVGFTNANQTTDHSGNMLRALIYAKIFNGLILSHAIDRKIVEDGIIHEGNASINLGIKGIPSISEEIVIMRDLELAKYANAKIHFSHISTKGSVELIKKAKKQNIKVTCDVAIANLCFTDDNLINFDTNFKTIPPLRSKADKKALWDGLADGTIDCIVSDHRPQHTEAKNVEFEYALAGMNTLQTAINLFFANAPKEFSLQQFVNVLCHNPNKILNQPENSINIGKKANMFLFDLNKNWTFDENTNFSKSKNTPLFNTTLTGKTIAVITKNKFQTL